MSDPYIPLTEVIGALRQELIKAQSAATIEGLLFEVGEVELELQVVITKEEGEAVESNIKGEVGFKIPFLTLKGGVSASASSTDKNAKQYTQKIKIKLSPKNKGDEHGAEGSDASEGLYISACVRDPLFKG
jgi:hypothetical protein